MLYKKEHISLGSTTKNSKKQQQQQQQQQPVIQAERRGCAFRIGRVAAASLRIYFLFPPAAAR